MLSANTVQYFNRRPQQQQQRQQQQQQEQQQQQVQFYHEQQACNQLTNQCKRKEKARLAARTRRSQEASIIMEMANELHITHGRLRFDKATIIRLAIEYIKAFDKLCRFCNHQFDHRATTTTAMQPMTMPIRATTTTNLTTKSNKLLTSSKPQVSTISIFSKRNLNDESSNKFLILTQDKNGKSAYILKPEEETKDDDLTHLAPQAGEVVISLNIEEPLDSIELDNSLSFF